MHDQQVNFCKSVKNRFPSHFHKKRVLDIGSGDINGTNNFLFTDCCIIRNDVLPGPNVDVACFAHDLPFVDNSFDTIISTECFEHDKFYDKTLKTIVRLLKPGGLFLFTCASTGREEHGTKRTSPTQSLTSNIDELSDYYKNLTEADIREVIDIDNIFHDYEFQYVPGDLYFYGLKR